MSQTIRLFEAESKKGSRLTFWGGGAHRGRISTSPPGLSTPDGTPFPNLSSSSKPPGPCVRGGDEVGGWGRGFSPTWMASRVTWPCAGLWHCDVRRSQAPAQFRWLHVRLLGILCLCFVCMHVCVCECVWQRGRETSLQFQVLQLQYGTCMDTTGDCGVHAYTTTYLHRLYSSRTKSGTLHPLFGLSQSSKFRESDQLSSKREPEEK